MGTAHDQAKVTSRNANGGAMTIHEILFRLLVPATVFRKKKHRVDAGIQLVELVEINLLSPLLFLPFALYKDYCSQYPVVSVTAYGAVGLWFVFRVGRLLRKRQHALEAFVSEYFKSPRGFKMVLAFGLVALSIAMMLAGFIQILRYYFA
jgi:hypothetical protein